MGLSWLMHSEKFRAWFDLGFEVGEKLHAEIATWYRCTSEAVEQSATGRRPDRTDNHETVVTRARFICSCGQR
jgi:hypothetical protein